MGKVKRKRFNQRARLRDVMSLIKRQAGYERTIAESHIDHLVQNEEIGIANGPNSAKSNICKQITRFCSNAYRYMLESSEIASRRAINCILGKDYIQSLEDFKSPGSPSIDISINNNTFEVHKYYDNGMPDFLKLGIEHLKDIAKAADPSNTADPSLDNIKQAAEHLKLYIKDLSKAIAKEKLLRASEVLHVKINGDGDSYQKSQHFSGYF